MSEQRKKQRFALWALIVCVIAGAGFLYLKSGLEEQTAIARHIPAMGLPTPPEIVELFDETRTYWSAKVDVAAMLASLEGAEKIGEPVLIIEEMREVPIEQATFEQKVVNIIPESERVNAPRPQAELATEPDPVSREPNTMVVAVVDDGQKPEDAAVLLPSNPTPEPVAVVSKAPLPVVKEAPVEEPVFTYEIEEDILQVEGVLVPQKSTVISSSRDGKIKDIFVDNGDLFQAGDILLAYDCQDLNAEIEAMNAAEKLAQQKAVEGRELFKLDIISGLEKKELEVEEKKAKAQNSALAAQMEACIIRASYDGRVTNRLANSQEYTRTDRVLMEVASRDALEIEFIVPSKWLRHLNIGAPITINIAETEQTYAAKIHQIYGEVDPVSQSIQMSARLTSYDDPLLPGMSGRVRIDAYEVRRAGVRGYLERKVTKAHGGIEGDNG